MSKPKIRFKGYEEDWEQRKVKEFAIESEVKGHSGKDAKKLTVKLHNKGVYVADEKIQGSDNTQYYIRRAGQFIYGKQNFFNGAIGIVPKKLDKYESTKDVPAFDVSSDVNVDWLYYYIARPEIYKPQEALCTGTGSKRFHVNNFYNLSLAIPKMDEQIKIKEYFVHLDNLITLHQRKCEETKKLKKYMLQKMFPQNGKRVPEIRFVGFTEDWEQRKLGDIAEFSKGSGYSKGDLIESGTPIILYGRLYTKYETSISEVDTYVEAKDGSVYSKGGEVIVPASGETAEDIARAATVDKSGVILGGDLNVVSPNEDINSAFLAISISHGNSQRELAKKAQGKSVVHIHNEEIKNLVVPFPTKAEQNKIVEYFSSLDNLITLHQRKYEELQKIKKFMLQNMFI